VASAAGVPASTVVYHFGASDDLVIAGLEAVIHNFRDWLQSARKERERQSNGADDEESYRMTRDLVRATHAVAVGAMRHPALQRHAADMRRRRGENVQLDDVPELQGVLRNTIDPLTAQVVSVATFGARMLAMAIQEDEQSAVLEARRALAAFW
jgi:AcrR family transcriptional regulator